ncbi:unnamed protein product [Oppiella nova]|uniref:Uncharacterized protein n=1 Tax=Oppiella nova TaxID=334625 RepID=A0A7R9M3H5_9ACAR|nr:unnamed protein product [Oppiella nova]CAG2170083.1 unnamed protein product [Oppiella nova]
MDDDMDSSMAEWLDLTTDDIHFEDNYCCEEEGIFWGVVTDAERQYRDKWRQQIITDGDHNITADDGAINLSLDMTSMTARMSDDNNYSLIVSPMGSQSTNACIVDIGSHELMVTDAVDDYPSDHSMISTDPAFLLATSAGHVSINDNSLFVSSIGTQSSAGSVAETPVKDVMDVIAADVESIGSQSFVGSVYETSVKEVDVVNATNVSSVASKSFAGTVCETPFKGMNVTELLSKTITGSASETPFKGMDVTALLSKTITETASETPFKSMDVTALLSKTITGSASETPFKGMDVTALLSKTIAESVCETPAKEVEAMTDDISSMASQPIAGSVYETYAKEADVMNATNVSSMVSQFFESVSKTPVKHHEVIATNVSTIVSQSFAGTASETTAEEVDITTDNVSAMGSQSVFVSDTPLKDVEIIADNVSTLASQSFAIGSVYETSAQEVDDLNASNVSSMVSQSFEYISGTAAQESEAMTPNVSAIASHSYAKPIAKTAAKEVEATDVSTIGLQSFFGSVSETPAKQVDDMNDSNISSMISQSFFECRAKTPSKVIDVMTDNISSMVYESIAEIKAMTPIADVSDTNTSSMASKSVSETPVKAMNVSATASKSTAGSASETLSEVESESDNTSFVVPASVFGSASDSSMKAADTMNTTAETSVFSKLIAGCFMDTPVKEADNTSTDVSSMASQSFNGCDAEFTREDVEEMTAHVSAMASKSFAGSVAETSTQEVDQMGADVSAITSKSFDGSVAETSTQDMNTIPEEDEDMEVEVNAEDLLSSFAFKSSATREEESYVKTSASVKFNTSVRVRTTTEGQGSLDRETPMKCGDSTTGSISRVQTPYKSHTSLADSTSIDTPIGLNRTSLNDTADDYNTPLKDINQSMRFDTPLTEDMEAMEGVVEVNAQDLLSRFETMGSSTRELSLTKTTTSSRGNTSVKFNTSVRVRTTTDETAPIDRETPMKPENSTTGSIIRVQTPLKPPVTPLMDQSLGDSASETPLIDKSRMDGDDTNTTPFKGNARSLRMDTPVNEDMDVEEMADEVINKTAVDDKTPLKSTNHSVITETPLKEDRDPLEVTGLEVNAQDLLSPFDINKTMGMGAQEVDVPITQSLIGLNCSTTGRPLTQSTPQFKSRIPKPKASTRVSTPRYLSAKKSVTKPVSVSERSRRSSQSATGAAGNDTFVDGAAETSMSSMAGRTSRHETSFGLQSIAESPAKEVDSPVKGTDTPIRRQSTFTKLDASQHLTPIIESPAVVVTAAAMESTAHEELDADAMTPVVGIESTAREELYVNTKTPFRGNTSVKFNTSVRVRTTTKGMAPVDRETPMKCDDSIGGANTSAIARAQTPLKPMTPVVNKTLEVNASVTPALNKSRMDTEGNGTPFKGNTRSLRMDTPANEDMDVEELVCNETTTPGVRANASVKFNTSVLVRTTGKGMAPVDKETPIKCDDSVVANSTIGSRAQTPLKDMTPLINRTVDDSGADTPVADRTVTETPVKEDMDVTGMSDKVVEVNAKDLLSPFGFIRSARDAPVGDVPITMSLVDLNTTTRPLRQSTPRLPSKTCKPKASTLSARPLRGLGSPARPLSARKSPRLSTLMTTSRNDSGSDSTLDFILNEIKCNDSDDNCESFLMNDKQLV